MFSTGHIHFSFAAKIVMEVVLSLIVLLIFGTMLRNVFYKKARIKRVAKKGIEAKAVLLNVSHIKTNIKEQQPVRLQIRVYPEAGNNFVTEVPDFLPDRDTNKYCIGDSFTVKYNPANPQEMVIIS